MLPEKMYAALDLGETTAKLVIGTVYNEKFVLCGTFQTESHGINNGEVSSRSEIQRTVIELLEQAKAMSFEITKVVVVLPSTNLELHRRKAKNLINSPSQIVTQKDIKTLKEAVSKYQLGAGEMVIGIYPIQYYVDGGATGRGDPIGIRGNSIAIDTFVITLPNQLARPIVDAIQGMELEILDVIPAPMALATAITTAKERQDGVTVVDIGGKFNSVSQFYQDLFCAYKQGHVGGSLITEEVMKSLKNDKNQAEDVKKKYGSAQTSGASDLQVYYNKATGETVKEKDIVQVVESNLATIGEEVKNSILYLSKTAQGPIVIAGGVSNTIHIKQKFGETFDQEVMVRGLEIVGGNDAIYYPAIGAIMSHIGESSKIEVDLINY